MLPCTLDAALSYNLFRAYAKCTRIGYRWCCEVIIPVIVQCQCLWHDEDGRRLTAHAEDLNGKFRQTWHCDLVFTAVRWSGVASWSNGEQRKRSPFQRAGPSFLPRRSRCLPVKYDGDARSASNTSKAGAHSSFFKESRVSFDGSTKILWN